MEEGPRTGSECSAPVHAAVRTALRPQAQLVADARVLFANLSLTDRETLEQPFTEEVERRSVASGPTLRKRRERGLCMQIYAHICGDMPAGPSCTAVRTSGGLLAGLVIAWLARRQPLPLAFAGAAATTAALLGAIGCACAGLAGVAGLSIGIAVPIAAGRIQASSPAAKPPTPWRRQHRRIQRAARHPNGR